VYPVLSRRSGGLSIGINLSPDAACDYRCVYCQVDRSTGARSYASEVDLTQLRDELALTVATARDGTLFSDPSFRAVPAGLRGIADIAFSGNGEPTASQQFAPAVEIAASVRCQAGLDQTRIVLITNACHLKRPDVEQALAVMDENNGEVWAKLDAGTEAYYQQVNRCGRPLQRVLDNITAAARVRPVVIQSLFMRLNGHPPGDAELAAYVDRLGEIAGAGGSIKYVQIYTIARPPAETFVGPLANDEVDRIVRLVQIKTNLAARAYYGAG
jgi:wyosine [tRNA(Phe)-imidazoG37] synthetase (radical SAM superfamily)